MTQGLKKLATAHRLRKEALSWDDMKTTAGEYWEKAKEEFNKRPGLYTGVGTGITAGLTAAALAPKGKKTLAGVLLGLGFGVRGQVTGYLYKDNLDLQSAHGELKKINERNLQDKVAQQHRAESAEKVLQEIYRANWLRNVKKAQTAYKQNTTKQNTTK